MSAEQDIRNGKNDIPVQRLRTFLNFASGAFSDSSFVSFFNVRDNPHHVFICARSLHHLVEQLVKLYNIDWNYNGNNSGTNGVKCGKPSYGRDTACTAISVICVCLFWK